MNRFASVFLVCVAGTANAQVVINEIIQDPPGGDSNWEYIELYGKPGMDLTGYAIGLFKGGADENGDDIPETVPEIDEAFTLDGLSLGPTGFLILVNDDLGDAAFEADADATISFFDAQHIPTTDTAGNLANGDSSTYLLVRARPNHSISGGVSVYDPGYSFRKEPNPDSDFDGKLDFGIEGGGALQIDPLQIVDEIAWSDNGGKEYVRSSDQEISDTPNFEPDAVSRVSYFGTNPMLGNRVNGSGEVVSTRSADEEFIYGEIGRLAGTNPGGLPEFGFDVLDMQAPKGPTDPNGPRYDCPPSPSGEMDCTQTPGGSFLFDDIQLVTDPGLASETGFVLTPGAFNDDPRFGVTQFRFVTADFDFDGDADADDLSLIQSRVGATLDDRIDCVDDAGMPIIDPATSQPFQCYEWEGRGFNATEAMRNMDMADGPGGTNADAVTAADLAAAQAIIPVGRLCADQNGDDLITPGDFNAWILNFNGGDLQADTNQNGVLEPGDFNSWILAFNQGANGPTCNP
ncbi:MAG: hypothetical protein AAFO89_02295 [Planctomycetota bacterium]